MKSGGDNLYLFVYLFSPASLYFRFPNYSSLGETGPAGEQRAQFPPLL